MDRLRLQSSAALLPVFWLLRLSRCGFQATRYARERSNILYDQQGENWLPRGAGTIRDYYPISKLRWTNSVWNTDAIPHGSLGSTLRLRVPYTFKSYLAPASHGISCFSFLSPVQDDIPGLRVSGNLKLPPYQWAREYPLCYYTCKKPLRFQLRSHKLLPSVFLLLYSSDISIRLFMIDLIHKYIDSLNMNGISLFFQEKHCYLHDFHKFSHLFLKNYWHVCSSVLYSFSSEELSCNSLLIISTFVPFVNSYLTFLFPAICKQFAQACQTQSLP